MVDLATLIRKESQPIADTKIGRKKVYLYALTSKDMSSISELSDEEKSLENFKSLIRIISSLKKPDKSNKRTAPTEEFINSLSQVDLNKLAETYLETVYVKNINTKLRKPIEKITDEESIQFLYRILKANVTEHSETLRETIKNALDPFKNVREASLGISKKFNSYDFSSHAMEQARTIHQQRAQELEMARVTAEMTKESTNLLNALANDVAEYLVTWKAEADKNSKATKNQLWIAVFSLAVSVALSGAALYFSYKSYKQDTANIDSNNISQQKIIDLMTEENNNINALTKQSINIDHRFTEIIENQKALQQKLEQRSNKTAK